MCCYLCWLCVLLCGVISVDVNIVPVIMPFLVKLYEPLWLLHTLYGAEEQLDVHVLRNRFLRLGMSSLFTNIIC